MKKYSDLCFRLFQKYYLKHFSKGRYVELNYRLFKTFIKCIGINNFENINMSGEKWMIDILLKKYGFQNSFIYFDVGANVGKFAKEVLNAYPQAQGYLFEPNPSSYQKLQSNHELSSAKKFNYGCGERNEVLKFYDRSDIDGSSHASLYSEVISSIHKKSLVEIQVEIIALDSFCKNMQISNIDFLKIDTEGHELAVLKGAGDLISNNLIKIIQFEFNEMNVISRTFMRDFTSLLSNYQLHRLLSDGMMKLNNCILDTEIFGFQNIVAVNKNILNE
jgi:FkbM family methyltransferase